MLQALGGRWGPTCESAVGSGEPKEFSVPMTSWFFPFPPQSYDLYAPKPSARWPSARWPSHPLSVQAAHRHLVGSATPGPSLLSHLLFKPHFSLLRGQCACWQGLRPQAIPGFFQAPDLRRLGKAILPQTVCSGGKGIRTGIVRKDF